MNNPRTWDALSVAAVILCIVPEVASDLYFGLPSGPASWRWPIWLAVSTLVMGSPQIVMLAYMRATGSRALQVGYLVASGVMLGLFVFYITAGGGAGLRQVPRDHAAVGLFSISIFMALVSAGIGGLVLWARRPLYKNPGFVLMATWLASFLFNWAAFGGDPFSLVFLVLGTTVVWVVWLAMRFAWRVHSAKSCERSL